MVEILKREFRIAGSGNKDVSLPDPNPDFSPEEVLKHYIPMHSSLNNASVSGPEVKGSKLVFSFKESIGSKG